MPSFAYLCSVCCPGPADYPRNPARKPQGAGPRLKARSRGPAGVLTVPNLPFKSTVKPGPSVRAVKLDTRSLTHSEFAGQAGLRLGSGRISADSAELRQRCGGAWPACPVQDRVDRRLNTAGCRAAPLAAARRRAPQPQAQRRGRQRRGWGAGGGRARAASALGGVRLTYQSRLKIQAWCCWPDPNWIVAKRSDSLQTPVLPSTLLRYLETANHMHCHAMSCIIKCCLRRTLRRESAQLLQHRCPRCSGCTAESPAQSPPQTPLAIMR